MWSGKYNNEAGDSVKKKKIYVCVCIYKIDYVLKRSGERKIYAPVQLPSSRECGESSGMTAEYNRFYLFSQTTTSPKKTTSTGQTEGERQRERERERERERQTNAPQVGHAPPRWWIRRRRRRRRRSRRRRRRGETGARDADAREEMLRWLSVCLQHTRARARMHAHTRTDYVAPSLYVGCPQRVGAARSLKPVGLNASAPELPISVIIQGNTTGLLIVPTCDSDVWLQLSRSVRFVVNPKATLELLHQGLINSTF